MLQASGWLAQLGEHQPYKLGVTGSIPVPPTISLLRRCGPVVQLVRIPACHAGGRGFESRPVRHFTQMLLYFLSRYQVSSDSELTCCILFATAKSHLIPDLSTGHLYLLCLLVCGYLSAFCLICLFTLSFPLFSLQFCISLSLSLMLYVSFSFVFLSI